MQLVAMGAQDVFLTGNPQITFFKVVYRRHTNFSKEAIEQEFNGSGNNLTATLARNGDLVQEIYLVAKVKVSGNAGDADYNLRDHIDTVELEIGGQKIDKHYAQWLSIYDELFESSDSHSYLNTMNTCPKAANSTEYVYYPLRFWFNRNAGLALPLIALQYHEVKVLLSMKQPAAGLNLTSVDDKKLLVNYVYLDTDERRRFAQVSHEYLIEQVQHTGVETISTPPAGGKSGKVDMNFNHPVKALFWNTSAALSAGGFLDDVNIQLNGHDRFKKRDGDYFKLVQPYETGLGHGAPERCDATKPNTQMYSFCLKPGEHQPSGSCNFSRIDNARLVFNAKGNDSDMNLHLFAMNYNVLRIMSGMGGLTYSN